MSIDTATARGALGPEIRERTVEVHCNGRRVPAVLWIPPGATTPVPLVLVGHGGGGHKRAPTVLAMAEGLAREHGIATLAIDGPVNGEREANDDAARLLRTQDRHAYRRTYYLEKYDAMVEDWRAALDAAQQVPEIDNGAVGYWGLSMGTRFGVPLIAADPRIRAAVIGLFGHREGAEASQRVYDDASKIDVPVLFLQQLQRRRGRPARLLRAVPAHWNGGQATARQSRRTRCRTAVRAGGVAPVPGAQAQGAARWLSRRARSPPS